MRSDSQRELERIVIHMSHAAADLLGAMNSNAVTVHDLRGADATRRLRLEVNAFKRLILDNADVLRPEEQVSPEEMAALTAPLMIS